VATVRRRDFISLVGGAAAILPITVRAQQVGKVFRIGFLANDPTIPTTAAGRAFTDGLREGGFVEGQNIAIERRFLEGRAEGALSAARELVRLNVDLIVTSGGQVHPAAKEATTSIPIVMVNAEDPVTEGLVTSLARPGGNITGLVQDLSGDLAGKRLQLFKDAVPQISRVAVFVEPGLTYSDAQWAVLQPTAKSLGVTLHAIYTRQGNDLGDALTRGMEEQPDSLIALNTPLSFTYRKTIVDFATAHRLPSAHPYSEAVQEGGLMSYGTNRPDLFRRAAGYVARILNGAKPADLPIEQPTKFEFVINLKTARALGLTISRDVLLIADEVIE
jgi:putative ABC transport system substrate-binding protein